MYPTMPELLKFDPYTYAGSENVQAVYAYMVICVTALLFAAVNYVVVRIGPPKQMRSDEWRWRNTLISWIHAVISALGVIYCLLFKPEAFEDRILYCDYYMYLLVAFSLGYFVYDLLDHVFNYKIFAGWEVVLHHITLMSVYFYHIHYRISIPWTVISLTTEINSVFLHARKLMLFNRVPFSNRWYRVVIVLNLLTVVTCRLVPMALLVKQGLLIDGLRLQPAYWAVACAVLIVMVLLNIGLLWRLFMNDVVRNLQRKSGKNGLGFTPLMNGVAKLMD